MSIPYQRQTRMGYTLYIGLSVAQRGRRSERLFPFIRPLRLAMPYPVSDHLVEAIAYTLYIGLSVALRGRHSEGLAPSAVFLRYSN